MNKSILTFIGLGALILSFESVDAMASFSGGRRNTPNRIADFDGRGLNELEGLFSTSAVSAYGNNLRSSVVDLNSFLTKEDQEAMDFDFAFEEMKKELSLISSETSAQVEQDADYARRLNEEELAALYTRRNDSQSSHDDDADSLSGSSSSVNSGTTNSSSESGTDGEEGHDCPICLEKGPKMFTPCCANRIHETCWERSLEAINARGWDGRKCPICKTNEREWLRR